MQTLSPKVQQYILRNMINERELITEHDELETYYEFALRIGVKDKSILDNAKEMDRGGK